MHTDFKEQSLGLSFGGDKSVDNIVGDHGLRGRVTMPLTSGCEAQTLQKNIQNG